MFPNTRAKVGVRAIREHSNDNGISTAPEQLHQIR